MSGASSIEWTDATWNPVRGCSRVSEGCRNCYAERQASRFSDEGQYAHAFVERTKAGPRWTGKVELVPSAIDWPLRWRGAPDARAEGRPSRIFVNSMSDLFHERLSDEAIAAVFGVMAACPQHVFQVLTKRPEHMLAWTAGPGEDLTIEAGEKLAEEGRWCHAHEGEHWPLPNVWLGTSVEDQATADERIPHLLATPAAVRFVSYEPALGPVDFRGLIQRRCMLNHPFQFQCRRPDHDTRMIDQVIVGGESGPGARPFDVAWARSTVEQCRAAGVACFVKQLGAWPVVYHSEAESVAAAGNQIAWDDSGEQTSARLVLRDRKGGDWSEWPEDLRVREFPT